MKIIKWVTAEGFPKLPCGPSSHSWEDILLLPLWRGRGMAITAAGHSLPEKLLHPGISQHCFCLAVQEGI